MSDSLVLRGLFGVAAADLRPDPSLAVVSGLSASAKALYIAAAARDGVVVLIVPTDAEIEPMVSDARFFVAALTGLGERAAEEQVLPFPSLEVDPYRGLSPHFDVASARAAALDALAGGRARVVVASSAALLPRVSDPARLRGAAIDLMSGREFSPDLLADMLADAGFSREDPVDEHGEFCVRGGIVDVFPAGDAEPVRIEFAGDTVESIRRYDPSTQRSVTLLDRVRIVPLRERFPAQAVGQDDGDSGAAGDAGAPTDDDRPGTFFDYASGAGAVVLVSERDDVFEQAKRAAVALETGYEDALARGERAQPPSRLAVEWPVLERVLEAAGALEELAVDDPSGTTSRSRRHVAAHSAIAFRGRVGDWAADVARARNRHDTVLVVVASQGRAERVVELLREYGLVGVTLDRAEDAPRGTVLVATGQLTRGFRLVDSALQVYAEGDIFDEERRVHERRRAAGRAFLSDFRDLKVGDHVVHVDHGIGLFVGLRAIAVGHQAHEFMELRYANDDKLFVPVERLDLVQKYSGGAHPALDRLGGATWEKAKTRVKRAMRDMAEELLKLYAARKAVAGHAFSPDSHWQQEFEDAFEYDLTPDQRSAIAEIKRDMETPQPMDRLLCGDVGYGKTEVAMRAAFKAVMDGKQVAILAPTTVLAFQHAKTFTERFAAFPVRIEMISRFRARSEQAVAATELAAGRIDVLVGTHRLLSKDVTFRDLGLLVVDEEQRFGVAHKERLKQLRRKVDVLTMTATPIPRTLNMSLVGIRDMSVIETPPKDRLSIQTSVVKFDQEVIRRAIRHELERGGQVYLVHNRVESIYSIGNLVTRLVPEARIAVAHGQMAEAELERVMVDFVARKYDVLVATTIIENGLDIPNANTIIVNRADRYGLAQLYQLRGRVGRSDRRAYAYLLIPPEQTLSPVARRRLAAIREFSDLGSGFRIAALDLEIRGAGNLLGGEQSGHIEAVGFEMYMKLLEETVRELKGEDLEDERRAAVNLKVDLRIDPAYIPDMNQRLAFYRRVAAARSVPEVETLAGELRDRYGPVPDSVLNLLEYGRIRVRADALGVETIDREGHAVVIRFRPDAPVDPTRIVALVEQQPGARLIPPVTLTLDLGEPPVPSGRRGAPRPQRGGVPGRRTSSDVRESWWTARATAGEVRPGFTRGEMLRPPPERPRDADGLFVRLGLVLDQLSQGAA